MNERDSFMKAILSEPGDDTARLVYADWLEEVGGEPERAAFIRVQVEIERLNRELRNSDEGKTAPEGFWKLIKREELWQRGRRAIPVPAPETPPRPAKTA